MKIAPSTPHPLRRRLRTRLTTLACLSLLAAGVVHAQSDDKAKADAASLERAQKQADQVFHWIKLNADKGADRAKPAPAPAPAPAPQVVKRAPAPAPAAVATRSVAPANTSGASEPAPAVAVAAETPAPQPAATVAAAPAEAPPTVVASLGSPAPAVDAPSAAAARVSAPPPPAPEEEDEVPLKLVYRVDPVIPRQLQSTLVKGFAQVRFTIEPNGTVSAAAPMKVSHTRLGTAAVAAVKEWRFAPIPKAREVAIELGFNNTSE